MRRVGNEMKERRNDIDLMKFIASIMVLILHGIEPGGGYAAICLFNWKLWNSAVYAH